MLSENMSFKPDMRLDFVLQGSRRSQRDLTQFPAIHICKKTNL